MPQATCYKISSEDGIVVEEPADTSFLDAVETKSEVMDGQVLSILGK